MLKREEGFALPYVIILSSLILILLFSLISIFLFYNKLTYKAENKVRLNLNCLSTLNKYLNYQNPLDTLFIEDSVQTKIRKSHYGLYDIIEVKSGNKRDSSKFIYFIGYGLKDTGNALILTHPNLSASVAGKTKINGNIVVPEDRIIPGDIFGIERIKADYLNGKIIVDKNVRIKNFNDTLMSKLFNIKQAEDKGRKEQVNGIINPQTLEYHQEDSIFLPGDVYFEGNFSSYKFIKKKIFVGKRLFITNNTNCSNYLEFYCDSSVFIDENVKLNNINIYANSNISISKGSHFSNIQFYSLKNINTEDCDFNYPCIMGIYVNVSDTANLKDSLCLKETVYNGTIMLVSSSVGLVQNKSKIKIDDKSKVQGFVYCENNAEIIGNIYGTVYTYNVWYYKEPTEYLNWLVNLTIDNKKLDKWFLLPQGFDFSHNTSILKRICIY